MQTLQEVIDGISDSLCSSHSITLKGKSKYSNRSQSFLRKAQGFTRLDICASGMTLIVSCCFY